MTTAPLASVDSHIRVIRGQRVMLDSDLAALYHVQTSRLNQAVKRNASRFPEDFMFQVTEKELKCLMSQIVISKNGRGGRRKFPMPLPNMGLSCSLRC